MTKAKSPYQKVNTRKREWLINEQGGRGERRDVTLYLDPRGTPTFLFALPEFIGLALGSQKFDGGKVELLGEDRDRGKCGELRSVDVEALERCLDDVLTRYSEHVRSAVAVPVILVHIKYAGRDEAGVMLSDSRHVYTGSRVEGNGGAMAQLSYSLAFRVGDFLHRRKPRYRDGSVIACGKPSTDDPNIDYVPGGFLGYIGEAKEVEYTPELHAELDRIIGVLNKAAVALSELFAADNLPAAITGMAQRMLPAPESPGA
jgi:hypothetical protein